MRKSFDAFEESLEERFGQPVLTRKTLTLFPVRVWRHFLARNGLLLAASMSYQALFAVFAGVYVGFSIAGIWLMGGPDTLNALIDIINNKVPGLIGEGGVISSDDLQQLASTSASVLGWTGVFALAGLIWTAIGWITYSRLSVRSIFGMENDTRGYVLLKARDLLAAVVFGTVLLVAAALSVASTAALDWLFGRLGIGSDSIWFMIAARGSGLLIVLVIDTGVLAAMFRVLSGAAVAWRRLWGGSLLGGLALGVLQVLGSTLIESASTNPLLATFAVFVGLLLWFRLTGIVMLVAAAWIAVSAGDRGESLRRVSAPTETRNRAEQVKASSGAGSKSSLRNSS